MRSAFHQTPAPVPPVECEYVSRETAVRCRVLSWCSTWSSVNGALRTEGLRAIAAPGPVRLSSELGSELGGDMGTCETFEDYAAAWAPWLAGNFDNWILIPEPHIRIRLQDGMAAADFNSRFHATTRSGDLREERHRVLQVWEQFGDKWRLTQEQSRQNLEEAEA